MKIGLLLSFLLLGSVFAEENPCEIKDYCKVASFKVEEISNYVDVLAGRVKDDSSVVEMGKIVKMTDQLIAVGKKVWALVENGRPVNDLDMRPAVSVLPNSKSDPVESFYLMSNWKMPETKAYRMTITNGLGFEAVVFEYAMVYQYGGDLDGKGKYLTAVDIVPIRSDVIWGYSFNASSSLVGITNVGSKDDPIASASLKLVYETSTILKSSKKSVGFYVQGDGKYKKTF